MRDIRSPFDGFRSPFGARGGFNPLVLFAASEPGAWYDPSDISTLFQDSAGTTPVTAAGQPVGRVFDKSKGLVLGAELVTNGGFDSDTAWVDSDTGTGASVISGGLLTLTFSTLSNLAARDQSFPTVSGRSYRVTCTVSGSAPSLARLDVGTTQGGSGLAQRLGLLAQNFLFVASGSTTWVRLGHQNAIGSLTYDNISVRELPGNHAAQSTAAARPTYRTSGDYKWLYRDGVDDVLNAAMPNLGTNATVAYASDLGVTILTGQTIGAGPYDVLRDEKLYGFIAINRPLTASETAGLTRYLTAKMEP